MTIENSVFIVTGGSSGIGKATARKLVDKGAKVCITGREKAKLERAAAEVGAMAIHADVQSDVEIQMTIDKTLAAFGRLDGLINNAGIGWRNELLEVTRKDFERTYAVNVIGAAMMAQAAARVFVAQKHGNIVNIASTAALKGYAGGSVYASSKWALKGMTQAWQAELRKYNVRVMLVNPSEVTTAFAQVDRQERTDVPNKLRGEEIAHAIVSALEMDDRGFIPELTVFATNPF